MSTSASLSWFARLRRRVRGILNGDVIVLGPDDVALVWRDPMALPVIWMPDYDDREEVSDSMLEAAAWAVALGCMDEDDEVGQLVTPLLDWFIEKAEEATDDEDLADAVEAAAAPKDE